MSKDKKREKFLQNLEEKLKTTKRSSPKRPLPSSKKPFFSKHMVIMLAGFLLVGMIMMMFNNQGKKDELVPYSEFIKRVEQKDIKSCLLIETESGDYVEFHYQGTEWRTKVPSTHLNLVDFLLEHKVHVDAEKRETNKYFLVFLQWLPWLILMVFFLVHHFSPA